MAAVWRTPCAFARLLSRKSSQILNNSTDFAVKLTPESLSVISSRKYSNYKSSPFVDKIEERYDFEVVKNPPEWSFVERLLPYDTIPQYIPKEKYPSGWIPPKEEAVNNPYFIPRTKNHELPIYLKISHRGQRRVTFIKKIEGDIWMMNDIIKDMLKTKYGKYIETRVHELARFIEVKGDYVIDVRDWALSKGF